MIPYPPAAAQVLYPEVFTQPKDDYMAMMLD